ncbi:hypothetical protein DVH24_004824 [Malus domestica]|uniref:Uncharacterized protein n=1 Tax=Malus domestica TaxID=3750 RepID=A0A498ICF1_MALDO|nr:hypothetical protein DVH24_004824 [Malus domestica]
METIVVDGKEVKARVVGSSSRPMMNGGEDIYIALAEAGKKAFWLNGLTREFGIAQSSMVIRCVKLKAITIEKVHIAENVSDYLIKPVTTMKFKYCLNSLNLITC